MEFRLLGAFEVWDDNQPVEIAGLKRRALLALLVLRANEVVRSERLVDELWGERPPRNANAALQNHVSRLRKTLGADTIASREWGYVLRATPAEIDLQRFEGLVAEAEPLPARERATKLAEALALWRGPPLADLVNEPALQRDIARLEELRLSTLERRIDADLELGRSADLAGELEALVAEQPLREHLRWLLILALYRAGRQAEALEVYRETRRLLIEELGLEPSPALKELEQAILRQDPSLDVNLSPTPTEPAAAAPEPKRRRVAPVALVALLALGLAGTATAIAVARQQRSASPGISPTAVSATLPTTAAHPTDELTITITKPKTASAAHTTSSAATTSTRPALSTRHATTSSSVHTTPTPAHRTHTPKKVVASPKPVTIADDFSDPTLDPLIWNSGSGGTGASFTLANGQLVFSIAADATFDPQYNYVGSEVTTKCSFLGAFDARIDYQLLQWPAENGATIILSATGVTTVEVVQRMTETWGDGYNGWPNGTPVMPLPDQSGSLRLSRSHGIVRAAFLHDHRWIQVGSKRYGYPVVIGVDINSNQGLWQHQDVSAAVDDFVVKAPLADCPSLG